ncbi:MAG: extracellular solute-binding protein [Alphaproteobacteria bacterium]|nr:extracellular solute-binding protein [Alphaproteobacteria bacterium]
MMDRITRRQALGGLAGVGLAGAGLSQGALAQAATELSFWTWRQEDRSQYSQLFGAFTQANPAIRVGFRGFEAQNYGTALSTALAAGQGPDVIHIRAYGGTEQFARAGYLHPLSREAVPELANFSEAALGSVSMRSDRQVYAVPFASQTLGVFVNREIFSRFNLSMPETWDQFLALCKTLKDRGVIPLANGMNTAWMVEVFTSVFAVPQYGLGFQADLVGGRATFEDPRYVGALEKLTALREFLPTGFEGVDYPTMQQLFLSGRAAMFAGGSFEIANFRRQNPNLQMEFHAPPAPAAGQPRLVSLFFDGGYAINAKTDKRDAAIRLIRYLSTPEFGTRFSALLGNISPIRGATIEDPMLARVAQLNQSAGDYMMAVHFRYQDPTGSTLLQAGVQRLMGGQQSAAQVAADVTRGIATYHAPFRRG